MMHLITESGRQVEDLFVNSEPLQTAVSKMTANNAHDWGLLRWTDGAARMDRWSVPVETDRKGRACVRRHGPSASNDGQATDESRILSHILGLVCSVVFTIDSLKQGHVVFLPVPLVMPVLVKKEGID